MTRSPLARLVWQTVLLSLTACGGGDASTETSTAADTDTDTDTDTDADTDTDTDSDTDSDTDTDTDADTSTDTGAPVDDGVVHWTSADPGGVAGRWGGPSVDDLWFGGLNVLQNVGTDVLRLTADGDGFEGEVVATMTTPRYCGCALHDAGRDVLVVIGGRNDGFVEEATAERIDLVTGEAVLLPDDGAAGRPVGCWAAFSDLADRGYVFSGYGTGFGDTTYRYDPVAETFTALGIAGPPGRYDGGMLVHEGGDLLLVGGAGDAGMLSDVWRLDPAAETWTEVSATTPAPPGRRFPFVALDGDRLYYGYGTDSLRGDNVLDDLWSFDLSTGVWTELQVDGEAPTARAFAALPPAPEGALGTLAFGVDDSMAVLRDAWTLWPGAAQ